MLLDYAYLSLIFIEVKYLQIVFRATQTVDVAIFFYFFFFWMIFLTSRLKFNLPGTTPSLTGFYCFNLSGLKKIYSSLMESLQNHSFNI